MALLLTALGHSDAAIAHYLGCDHTTVGRRLGPRGARRRLSPAEISDLFEHYDARRNMEEILMAASGSVSQARLRNSLRVRKQSGGPHAPGFRNPDDALNEDISDEQIRREVGALVEQARYQRGDP
ncbi:MAG: hypothetical protein AAFR82_02880 [Pseudomonadota bacterium]